jgi:tyrosinase
MMQPATTIRTCLALLVALSCIFAAVFSSPIDSLHPHFVDDLSELVDARAENVGNFKIRGVQDGSIQVRQEIRQFASDSDLLNLFLLSLESFQAMNQNDTLSYYQVAGIHGVPYVSWDGGFGPRPNPTDGYCAHYSNIFLPWHRPYVALFEVSISSNKAVNCSV